MEQTIKQRSFEIAHKEIPGWVPVAISEKKHEPSWGEQGRCFMIALRKPEHAHLPFPGSMDTTVEEIPNRALCFMWQGSGNYTCKEIDHLFEFSHNPNHPTVNAIMEALLQGIAQQN